MPFGSLLKKLKIFFSVFWHYKMPNKLISFLKIGNRYFWIFSMLFELEFKISRRKHLIQHCQQNFLSLIRFLYVVTCPFLVVLIFNWSGFTGQNGFKRYFQLAEFEIGFIVCLILGLLFVVLFPIIGIFFCGCRCCDNCGGRLYQDMKDATSGWRIFHCISLMITTTCKFSPTSNSCLDRRWSELNCI